MISKFNNTNLSVFFQRSRRCIQITRPMRRNAPKIDIQTISAIIRLDKPPLLESTSGTLAPIVAFMQAKNVMFSPDGRGVSSLSGKGAVSFDEGMLLDRAALLLYPSSDKEKEEAR